MSKTTNGDDNDRKKAQQRNPSYVKQLFVSAHAEGALSISSLQALTAVDLGAQIQAGLGIAVDDVQGSEVVLLTIMPDDSSSMRPNERVVCDGHNLVLDAVGASKQRDAILAHTRYLNGTVLFPYRPIDLAIRMGPTNFQALHGTPLYDESVVILGSVLAKTRELESNGVAARSITLLITDGADESSRRAKARDVAALVADLDRGESHIVAGMGISNGATDFRRVFGEMGIRDRWILTPGNTQAEIRSAFQVFSQSAIRASKASHYSQAGLGGFGA
jgi:hypothetical protein